jgi:hypothetical protein
MKYTDADHSINMQKNDVVSRIVDTVRGENLPRRRQENDLPPSKPLTGRRLMTARAAEATVNNRASKGKKQDRIRAETRFTKGPARQRTASLV